MSWKPIYLQSFSNQNPSLSRPMGPAMGPAMIRSLAKSKVLFGARLISASGSARNATLLTEIASLLDNQPDAETGFEVDGLDRIADGAPTAEDEGDVICEIDWFGGFLDSVNWWRSAAESLLMSNKCMSSPDPDFAEQGEEIFRLLGDVLMAYVPAQREWIYADDQERGASMELLKRYRLFTRYVCAFARELFPGTSYDPINLAPLLDRA